MKSKKTNKPKHHSSEKPNSSKSIKSKCSHSDVRWNRCRICGKSMR